jgi:hypothetical protein
MSRVVSAIFLSDGAGADIEFLGLIHIGRVE